MLIVETAANAQVDPFGLAWWKHRRIRDAANAESLTSGIAITTLYSSYHTNQILADHDVCSSSGCNLEEQKHDRNGDIDRKAFILCNDMPFDE